MKYIFIDVASALYSRLLHRELTNNKPVLNPFSTVQCSYLNLHILHSTAQHFLRGQRMSGMQHRFS